MTSQPELLPDLLAMIQSNMNDYCGHSSKRQGVGQGELCREEKRRILLVGCLVEMEIVVENACNIVDFTHVVVGVGGLDWEVIGVPSSGEVNAHGNTDEEDENANENVGNGVKRWD